MRIYAGAGRTELNRLKTDGSVRVDVVVPDSDDEADEFAALEQAATQGPVVIAADIDDTRDPVELDDVAAWHVDADASGHLAWFAVQELDHVLALLE